MARIEGYYVNQGGVCVLVYNYGWYNACSKQAVDDYQEAIGKKGKCKHRGTPMSGNWYRRSRVNAKVGERRSIGCAETEKQGELVVSRRL